MWIPARSAENLDANAICLPLVVSREFHQVTVREELGAGLGGRRAPNISQERTEQTKKAIGQDALRNLRGSMPASDVSHLVGEDTGHLRFVFCRLKRAAIDPDRAAGQTQRR